MSAEDISFPLARQAALVRRETSGRKVEVVALVTSLPPADLDTTAWLRAKRQHWGIENSLHQRLDASHNDDCCRVRTPAIPLVHGHRSALQPQAFLPLATTIQEAAPQNDHRFL